jgi:hypothetical protein
LSFIKKVIIIKETLFIKFRLTRYNSGFLYEQTKYFDDWYSEFDQFILVWIFFV